MPEKTPRELLRETLDRNAKEIAALPAWVRASISTESIFKVKPFSGTRETPDGEQNQPV